MSPIACIAVNTFRELVRGKVLYSIIFFACLVVAISALFGSVTVGDQIMVIKDFGLFSISIFATAFAVIAGAALLHKELARKTIYNILAKPVERYQFLWGKYLGMLMTLALMIALMGLALNLFLALMTKTWDWPLFGSLLYVFFELMIICAAAIFFSSLVVTPVLSGLFTFGIFLAGRCADYVLYFIQEGHVSGLGAALINAVYWILPHLPKLNVANEVVYGDTSIMQASRLMWSLLYSLGYATALMILSSLIFRNREFN